MKKIFLFAAMAVLSISGLLAQNNFRGTIIYTVKSTGEEEFKVPDEIATAEIKVFDDKVKTSSKLFTNQLTDNILVEGRKSYMCMDLSMIMMYLSSMDVELDYKGSSKILVKSELTQSQIDSLTIPVTEGYYIDYSSSETKTVAGYKAKKAIFHIFNEDGEDKPMTFWYTDEMGPAVNPIFNGLKGIALEYTIDLGEGKQLTLTATEIKSGKVKSVDMLLPSGYEELSEEEFSNLFKQINEELEYLQED